MKCPNCNKNLSDEFKFCPYCGSKVVVENKCPHCGAHPLPEDAMFCPDCGHSIEHSQKNQRIKEFTVGCVSFRMIRVDGGIFSMGSNDSEALDYEKPVHYVKLGDYYIGETQVTQALWRVVMGYNPSTSPHVDNLPVNYLYWDDCQQFVNKLNQLTGKAFRLPTEAEWEFAAKGGRNSKGFKYSGSNNIDVVAWHKGNSGINTHPVGTKQANELGIYDMTGNVAEWCSDYWKENYSSSAQTNPKGPNSGSYRVLRGGSYDSISRFCRVSHRNANSPVRRYSTYGLRLALSE